MRNSVFALALLLLVSSGVLAAPPDDEVFRAMQDELDRSMAELQLGDLNAPYFISYSIWDISNSSAQATLGVLQSSQESNRRILSVEVRVGDYALDNSNFQSGGYFSYSGLAYLPVEDDYTELRRQLWLTTDAAYKEALESLSQKTAALQNRVRDEELPDFAMEPAVQVDDTRPAVNWDQPEADALVRDLSLLFRQQPEIQSSRVELSASTLTTRYVNSEGSRFFRTTPGIALAATAYTQAEDGRPIEDAITAFGRQVEDLPPRSELTATIEVMIERIQAARRAPLQERYNGPVLFSGQAAAEIFAQRFAPALVATRAPVTQQSQGFSAYAEAGAQWEDRLGGRVLPRFMAVVDDPTVDILQGKALVSAYRVDDEAVAAKPTLLVENGRLKRLLSGRTPVAGIEQSSGNMRAGAVMPSSMIVTASSGMMTTDELINELLILAEESGQEFGLLVTRIANPALGGAGGSSLSGFMNGGAGQETLKAQEAFRIYRDGRRERIRNLELSGVSAASFRDIIAVSDEPFVYNSPYSVVTGVTPGMMAGAAGTSTLPLTAWAVPDLLFEELTAKKPGSEYPTLPIISRPTQ